jgi:hypothetical protein
MNFSILQLKPDKAMQASAYTKYKRHPQNIKENIKNIKDTH